jgi:DNA-binding winged helix-turn-helix (wHTH) protein
MIEVVRYIYLHIRNARGAATVNDFNPTTRIEKDEPFAPVTKRPVLTVLRGESLGLVLEIERERTTIGRGAQADLVLNDTVASRQHAEIVRAGADSFEFRLRDLGSTNGTTLNGFPIESEEPLRDGDKIRIGKHLLKFSMLEPVEVAALSKSSGQESQGGDSNADCSDVICFSPFHIVVDVDLLYRGEQVVPLEPRAVRVLKYLAEHSERVVSKEELLEAVWPDVFTSDGVLKKAISQARHALCDDAKASRFIQTYHRRGYRFIAPVQRDDSVSR